MCTVRRSRTRRPWWSRSTTGRIIRRSPPGMPTSGTRTERARQRRMNRESSEAILPVESLRAFAVDLLGAAGVPAEAAGSVADGLITADVEGLPSHGLMLLTMYLDRLAGG